MGFFQKLFIIHNQHPQFIVFYKLALEVFIIHDIIVRCIDTFWYVDISASIGSI